MERDGFCIFFIVNYLARLVFIIVKLYKLSLVCILSFSDSNNPLLNHMCIEAMLICIMS